jgi:hypothetical protein
MVRGPFPCKFFPKIPNPALEEVISEHNEAGKGEMLLTKKRSRENMERKEEEGGGRQVGVGLGPSGSTGWRPTLP